MLRERGNTDGGTGRKEECIINGLVWGLRQRFNTRGDRQSAFGLQCVLLYFDIIGSGGKGHRSEEQ